MYTHKSSWVDFCDFLLFPDKRHSTGRLQDPSELKEGGVLSQVLDSFQVQIYCKVDVNILLTLEVLY